jgi:hypothetical protein
MYLFYISVDINECLPASPCHVAATCNNTEGSYNCACDSGYSGDGVTCNGKKCICMMKIAIATTTIHVSFLRYKRMCTSFTLSFKWSM